MDKRTVGFFKELEDLLYKYDAEIGTGLDPVFVQVDVSKQDDITKNTPVICFENGRIDWFEVNRALGCSMKSK